ncbi:MAG: hypothetical protein ACJ77K_06940 [Bacteroidia bacterium]
MRLLRFIPLAILFHFAGCERPPEKLEDPAYVNIPPPPVPKLFYTELNLVVDREDKIYYYIYRPKGWLCGTGLNSNFPYFIDLSPEKIIPVSIDTLEQLSRSVFLSDTLRRFVYIGIDSSKKALYLEIKNRLRAGHWDAEAIQRQQTEEEATVLAYKRSGAKYNSWTIDWKNPNIDCRKKEVERKRYIATSNLFDSISVPHAWLLAEKINDQWKEIVGDKNQTIEFSFDDWKPEVTLCFKHWDSGKRTGDNYTVLSLQKQKDQFLFKTVDNKNDSSIWKIDLEPGKLNAKWSVKNPNEKSYRCVGTFVVAK